MAGLPRWAPSELMSFMRRSMSAVIKGNVARDRREGRARPGSGHGRPRCNCLAWGCPAMRSWQMKSFGYVSIAHGFKHV
eukprot:8714164-Pyramimonas_sp.AAC.1